MKQNIYDNKNFSAEYDKMRKEKAGYNANDLIEIPNFRSLVPSVKNKRVLDLGCGYGENCKYYKDLGANYVLGTDISQHMINMANIENKEENIDYKVLPMEELNTLNQKFDIVLSSLAFHYIKDFKKLINDIYAILNEEGALVFSQEHPMNTCIINNGEIEKSHIDINNKWFGLVADYNRCGLRKNLWNDEYVEKYHRNFSEIINTLVECGFKIEKVLEPLPSKLAISRVPKYEHQFDKPYFIFIKAIK